MVAWGCRRIYQHHLCSTNLQTPNYDLEQSCFSTISFKTDQILGGFSKKLAKRNSVYQFGWSLLLFVNLWIEETEQTFVFLALVIRMWSKNDNIWLKILVYSLNTISEAWYLLPHLAQHDVNQFKPARQLLRRRGWVNDCSDAERKLLHHRTCK